MNKIYYQKKDLGFNNQAVRKALVINAIHLLTRGTNTENPSIERE